MTTRQILTSTLVCAILMASGSARGADDAIKVVAERGKTIAEFRVGDSHCVLKDDRVNCEPVGR